MKMHPIPPELERRAGDGESESSEPRGGDGGVPLIAYSLPTASPTPIKPAPAGREWMRATYKQFAHRCLPLLMANQSGWFLLNDAPFRVSWDGGNALAALKVDYLGEPPEAPIASSMFGYGILTWHVNYLFRTPPGYNLLARGPANMPKDGICALDGIIETDWAVQSFTMNWKMTRPDHEVVFDEGEPFCMIVPQRRHELEEFNPTVTPIVEVPELADQWKDFAQRRKLMVGTRIIASLKGGTEAVERVPYERHYFRGTTPRGEPAPEHQQKLRLRPFEEQEARRGGKDF